MAERRIVVEARIRGTQLTTRIVVPQSLAKILIQNDKNIEETKIPGYIQARKSFKKETGRDPGWLSIENCDFKIIGEASWIVSGKEKTRKPFQRQLFRPKKEEEDFFPVQQKLF